MKSTLIAFAVFAALLLPVTGQERIIEISSRVGPVICEIDFYDNARSQVGPSVPIAGEKFFWSVVPADATKFALKKADVVSEVFPLELGHTYVRLNAVPVPGDPDKDKFDLEVSSRERVPAGNEGWVYVGKLEAVKPESTWESLYLVSRDRAKTDRSRLVTYGKFQSSVEAGETLTLAVNFPLYLRPTADPKSESSKIVRAGQLVDVLEVSELGADGKVYAKVKVK